MLRIRLSIILVAAGLISFSQNDVDAIRYSRIGGGGTSRFMAMGGAFGAVGADVSTAAYNPAGLAVFRKSEISFTGGLRGYNNTGNIYNKSTSYSDLTPVFNNFGVAISFQAKDPDSRHTIAFTSTQLQSFNNSVRMSGYTNSNSIAKDMLNLASYYNQTSNMTGNLNPMYEGLGYNAYLLDIDSVNMKFFSFVDLKRSVKQTRDVVTNGRVNDVNLSYAYSYKDKLYLGASLGLPQVSYESTTTHTEEDDRDSMRVVIYPNDSIATTYIDNLPVVYRSRLGFKSLTYTEYFKTSGSGFNLKLGGIVRLNDIVRVGLYYHTPTIYNLTDTYYNDLTVNFDATGSTADYAKYPADGGTYSYKIITPSKISANAAFIIKKLAVIGIDYEMVNYRSAKLSSSNISDFAGVNSVIKNKYSAGHNLRIGGELNLNPWMLRAGYQMQGSPFGDVFNGPFVRNTFSAGFGFRTKGGFFFDVVVYKTLSSENYFLFTTMDTQAKLNYNSTTVSATIGIKF